MSQNYLLVHGAWRGGWCWQRVSARVEDAGHNVYAPTLAGLAERAHLASGPIGLDTHIEEIVELIARNSLKSVVLVGHSYGGFVISGVAERAPASIKSIVFLDAFYPDNGQSVIDSGSKAGREAVLAALESGAKTVEPFSAAFFRVNEKDHDWVEQMCSPHPIKTFVDPISLTGKREQIGKKTYIRATGYPSEVYDKALSRLRADSTWRIYEIACGHDVMIDRPDELARILVEVA